MSENINTLNDINTNIDSRIIEKNLPIVLSLKNGVKGEEYSNPEIYLREFINELYYFTNLSNNEEYYAPISGINDECDAIPSCFQIDFKTLISSSMTNGKRKTSFQRIKKVPGVQCH